METETAQVPGFLLKVFLCAPLDLEILNFVKLQRPSENYVVLDHFTQILIYERTKQLSFQIFKLKIMAACCR